MASPIRKDEVLIGQDFSLRVISLIDSAVHSIDIIVYDWRFYPSDFSSNISLFNQSLVGALRRGVKVRVMVYDHHIFHVLSTLGFAVRRLYDKRKYHVKLMIIDNNIAIFGSHNYTKSAFEYNCEVSIVTYSRHIIDRLQQFYNYLYVE